MRYYIADCHFWHGKLNTHMDCRGFDSAEEMNEHMIRQWNRKVNLQDEVVILGDFCWGSWAQTEEILNRLNGRLHLIKGNHDLFVKDRRFNPDRFVWIRDYAELNDNRRKVVLCHYPVTCYNGQYRRGADGKPHVWMLHGHIHNTRDQDLLDRYVDMCAQQTCLTAAGSEERIPCQIINCFAQRSDYMPLSLDEWIELEKGRREHGKTGIEKRRQSPVCTDQGHLPQQNPDG